MKKIGWGILFVLALVIFMLSGRYLTMNPEVYFPQQKAVYLAHATGLMVHITGSMLALIIGPLQFLPGIMKKRIHLHRWLGRFYLGGVVTGGLGGMYMAFQAYGGLPAQTGFAALAILWLTTGGMAYKRIREKKIAIHRAWMIRNYALTFAAVTLRLWLVGFDVIGIPFIEGYITVAWLSWVPNLIIAELIIQNSGPVREKQTSSLQLQPEIRSAQ